MKVRLVPYSEVFVSVLMDLPETAEIAEALRGHTQGPAAEFLAELDAAMDRAAQLTRKEKRGNATLQGDSKAGQGNVGDGDRRNAGRRAKGGRNRVPK